MTIANLKNRQAFSLSEKERMEAISAAALSGSVLPEITLRHNGEALTPAKRDELLKKCAANEYVELHLDVIAYEQKAGVTNRNFVRIADNFMEKFGKTGAGKPFLRDHRQSDTLSVGGMIDTCSTENLGDGHYKVRESVTLTAPWIVDLALRGLLNFVSISWMATGPVTCSYCKENILTKCWHWPGDKFSLVEDKLTGGKKLQYDRNGSIVIEWVYQSCEIIETSPVPVPAVTSARIEGIRLSLAQTHGLEDFASLSPIQDNVPVKNSPAPTEKKIMEKTQREIELEAQVKQLNKLLSFTETERQFYQRLNASAAAAFMELSAADRAEEVKPIYTSKNGLVFNKSHDLTLIEMAKSMDAQTKAMDEKLAASKNETLLARADAELGHLPGTREERAALLGAVENIADEGRREYAKTVLFAKETKRATNFTRNGAGGGKAPAKSTSSKEKLDDLVRQHMEQNPDTDEFTAMSAVMETPAGAKLYAEIEAEKVSRRMAAQGIDQEDLAEIAAHKANN